MNCREFEDWLNRRLDREPRRSSERGDGKPRALNAHAGATRRPWSRGAIADHLRECAECRNVYRGYRSLRQGLVVLRAPSPSPDLAERVVRLACAEAAQRWRGSAAFARRFGRVAVAVVLLIGLLQLTWPRPTNRSQPRAKADANRGAGGDSTVSMQGERLIFPEFAPTDSEPIALGATGNGVKSTDRPILFGAAATFTDLVLTIGRNIGKPVEPITRATTGAVNALWNDIVSPEFIRMPAMPGMMAMPKRMRS